MRLSFFLFLFGTLNLIASNSYSQKTRISLEIKQSTVKEVLKDIENKSEFYFLYNNKLIDVNRKIDLNIKDKKIKDILDQVFKGTDVQFLVMDRQIVLTPRNIPTADNEAVSGLQQNIKITGKVTDKSGKPLPGVTVLIKGTTQGTITNTDGHYTLSNVPAGATLQYSFIGMRTQEVVVGTQTNIDITMEDENIGLDAVVVTALSLKREKKALGYSVGTVDGEDVNETPQVGVLNSMQGKVAGVQISQTYGIRGSSVSMIIRGASSLNSDNQPLFVVDGVPIYNTVNNQFNQVDLGNDVSDLNTDDIESISILKGPSAAALYGSRAANGVVLITTTSGARKKKGLGVNFSTSFISDIPYKYFPTQNEFASGQQGAFVFEGDAYEFWGPKLNNGFMAIQRYEDTPSELVSHENNINRQQDFYQNGWTQTNNLAINGDYDKANFRVSMGNYNNSGIMPNIDLQKNNIGINGNMKLSDKLSFTVMATLNESKSDNRPNNYDAFLTPTRAILTVGPQVDMAPYKDPETWWIDGKVGIEQRRWKLRWNNPYLMQEYATTGFKRTQTLAKVQMNWEIFKDFSFMARYMRSSSYQRVEAKKPWDTIDAPYGYFDLQNSSEREQDWEGMFSYKKQFLSNLDMSVNFGGSLRDNYKEYIHNSTNNLVVPEFYNIKNGAPGSVMYTNYWSEKKVNSLYGQVSLGYKNMVYLDLTARNDWSSTLPKDNWSYFYPSASLSILLSEMINMPKWISFAKVRAGYAQVGNDVEPYQLQRYYGFGTDWGDAKRASLSRTAKNAQLKPEIATSNEVGADLSFWDNRISLDGTYYVEDNKNQVLSISTPITSGASSKLINAGLVKSKGWDVTLNTTIIKNNNLSFDIGFNFTRNRTTIVELAEGIEYFGERKENVYFYTYPGGQIGDIYGAPLQKVEDVNSEYYGQALVFSNGKARKESDPDKFEKIGNYNPDFTMGIIPRFTYKRITVFANIDWRSGGEFFSQSYMFAKNNGMLAGYNGGESYDPNVDIVQQIKDNPDKFINKWVGGRDSEYGGFVWPDDQREARSYVNAAGETVYVNDASFMVGVRDDGNGGYIENFGGPGTIWLSPYNANKSADRELAAANIYSSTYVKVRELSITYDFSKSLINKLRLQKLSLSVIGQNLFTWTKTGIFIDPETAFYSNNGTGARHGGYEYYSVIPYTRSFGFKMNVEF